MAMTEQPEVPVGRGVIHVSTELLREMFHLPDGFEVFHIAPGHFGTTLAVVVEGPGVPQGPAGSALFELNPSYRRTPEGRVELYSMGL